jgi:hypothetical protein
LVQWIFDPLTKVKFGRALLAGSWSMIGSYGIRISSGSGGVPGVLQAGGVSLRFPENDTVRIPSGTVIMNDADTVAFVKFSA